MNRLEKKKYPAHQIKKVRYRPFLSASDFLVLVFFLFILRHCFLHFVAVMFFG